MGALAPLLPPGAAAVDHAGSQALLLQHWRRRAARTEGPTLVWLDDAQHLDATSAALLRHAVTLGTVQLVATARSQEPLPDDLTALAVEGLLGVTELGPLDPAQTVALARGLARRMTDTDCRRIVALSAGNPCTSASWPGPWTVARTCTTGTPWGPWWEDRCRPWTTTAAGSWSSWLLRSPSPRGCWSRTGSRSRPCSGRAW